MDLYQKLAIIDAEIASASDTLEERSVRKFARQVCPRHPCHIAVRIPTRCADQQGKRAATACRFRLLIRFSKA